MEWKRKEKGGRGVSGQNGAPERSEDLRHIISKTETPRSDIIPNYLIKTYPLPHRHSHRGHDRLATSTSTKRNWQHLCVGDVWQRNNGIVNGRWRRDAGVVLQYAGSVIDTYHRRVDWYYFLISPIVIGFSAWDLQPPWGCVEAHQMLWLEKCFLFCFRLFLVSLSCSWLTVVPSRINGHQPDCVLTRS